MQQMQSVDALATNAELIRVKGTVQGVGFRPFVWKLAQALKLKGRVWNDAQGVVIQLWGDPVAIENFRYRLVVDKPLLAHIEEITTSGMHQLNIPADFQIIASQQGEVLTNISPDAVTCPECLAEINDPTNRRYRYPFTNCTHCGPRLSIIKAVPYDRINTSMAAFTMCPQCQAEYDEPENRRFHAQPNACPDCGPAVWLENARAERIAGDFVDGIAHAANLLQRGHILAIKGIGGFHLACDASNADSVATLRQRKYRYQKPLAMMARDIELIHQYADVKQEEERLLKDRAAPIVLLSIKAGHRLAEGIAPGQTRLGFMLPYTPLHSLLLQDLDFPIVLTSGNLSDEVQCITNQQARAQLSSIADYLLLHDRDIVNRLDDSVVRVIDGKSQLLRRGRGYAPQPISLPEGFADCPDILAMGGELKNTFCLLKNGKAILSQHQGDLEDVSVLQDYQRNLKLFAEMYHHQPTTIAVDQHPNYISTTIGEQYASKHAIELTRVQHHHAHIVACMIEHDLPLDTRPVLGICLDGLGYGENGELWGGEFLLTDYCTCQRLARFQPVAMPGGTRAILEPWRNTFAHLQQSIGWNNVVDQYPHLDFVKFMQDKPIDNLQIMMERGLNSPMASSAGRLFDAVAALLGICPEVINYEGQAAMQLEAMAAEVISAACPYDFDLISDSETGILTIQWRQLWQALLSDFGQGVPQNEIAARFHLTLSSHITRMVMKLVSQADFDTVILSGGVMQNRLLLNHLILQLREFGHQVLFAEQVPANDGGIALGQAGIAAALYCQKDRSSHIPTCSRYPL